METHLVQLIRGMTESQFCELIERAKLRREDLGKHLPVIYSNGWDRAARLLGHQYTYRDIICARRFLPIPVLRKELDKALWAQDEISYYIESIRWLHPNHAWLAVAILERLPHTEENHRLVTEKLVERLAQGGDRDDAFPRFDTSGLVQRVYQWLDSPRVPAGGEAINFLPA